MRRNDPVIEEIVSRLTEPSREDIEQQLEALVPSIERHEHLETAYAKIRDAIVQRNDALEFIRSNLSKMHVDDNIRTRCLEKIKEVLG